MCNTHFSLEKNKCDTFISWKSSCQLTVWRTVKQHFLRVIPVHQVVTRKPSLKLFQPRV